METIADLVAAGRERDGVAIDAPDRSIPYSYRTLRTDIWKAGNLLGHYTHPGGTVAVAVGPGGEGTPGVAHTAAPLLGALGGTLVGATVALGPGRGVDADALVRPAGWGERCPAAAGCSVLAYGGSPADPAVEQFEAALWSENPVEPPERVDSATPAVRDGDGTHTHGALLDRAMEAVDRHGLTGASRVVPGDLRSASALAAGVLAPLSVGATVLLGDPAGAGDAVSVPDGSEGRKD